MALTDDALEQVAAQCAAALRRYLDRPDESVLLDGYDIGRAALASGLGVLDMTHVCSRALALVAAGSAAAAPFGAAAERLFREVLSPFEMAHRAFREANATLRRFNQLLEDQTRQIAGRLHDEAGQLLTPLHISLSGIAGRVAPEIAAEIDALRGALCGIEERLRALSHELRPPLLDQMALVPAVDLLVASAAQRWGLRIGCAAAIEGALPPVVETTIYRAIQESIVNVARHTNATAVDVSIVRRPRSVACTVVDNGAAGGAAGAAAPAGLGLNGIRERVAALGGVVRFGPAPSGRGMELAFDIPLET